MTKPERVITFAIVGILLLGGGGIWWQRAHVSNDPLAQAFREVTPPRENWFTPRGKHRTGPLASSAQLDALYRKILERHPQMAVTWKNVPDEKNGFLQWVNFGKCHRGENPLSLPSDIRNMLSDPGKWDAARAKNWLADNKALLDEIANICLLPDQSAHNVEWPNGGMLNAQLAKSSVDLLCLQARSLAASGDSAGALRSLRAAMGLANHLDQIETPCLLNLSISILSRLTVQGYFFEHISPTLPQGADLSLWQATVTRQPSPDDLARAFFGEWHVSLSYITLPVLITGDKGTPPDPVPYIDCWTDYTGQQIKACSAGDWPAVVAAIAHISPPTSGLSKQSTMLVSTLQLGFQQYIRGLARTAAVQSLATAAFAHLRGEPMPIEPITGLPYVWDPATKTLSAPADPSLTSLMLRPIKLPR